MESLKLFSDFDWESGVAVFFPIHRWWFTVPLCVLYVGVVVVLQKIYGPPLERGAPKPAYFRKVCDVAAWYNYAVSLFSVYLVYGFAKNFWRVWMDGSYLRAFCGGNYWNTDGSGGDTPWFIFLYCLSKPIEFIDTIFRVILRKPVIFLHIWHHFTVPIHMLIMWRAKSQVAIFGALFNSFVHVWMYFYYGRVSQGIRVWWKELVTILQLAQFSICFIILIVVLGNRMDVCLWDNSMKIAMSSICTYYLSYFVLFVHFYVRTYCGKKKGKKPKKEESSPEEEGQGEKEKAE